VTARSVQPVLVVEDDADTRQLLATLLAIEGYEVVTARNGAEGLIAARQHQPCVILLDLMMPVLDGQGFRAEQVADAAIANVPVLIVSARHDCAKVARSLGAAGCVQKPFVPEDVIREVATACEEPGA
jgi:CheY-like chemotaxis protein